MTGPAIQAQPSQPDTHVDRGIDRRIVVVDRRIDVGGPRRNSPSRLGLKIIGYSLRMQPRAQIMVLSQDRTVADMKCHLARVKDSSASASSSPLHA